MADALHPLFVLYLPQEWHDYVRRPHWSAIAKLASVLAIEPPVAMLGGPDQRYRKKQKDQHGDTVRQAESGVWLFRPQALVSFGAAARIPWLGRMSARRLAPQVRQAIAQLDRHHSHVVSVVVKAQQFAVPGAIDEDLAVYEVTDDYSVFPDQMTPDPKDRRSSVNIAREKDVLAVAGLVVASSEKLRDTRRMLNPNTRYLPNCADFQFFAKATKRETVIPDDLAALAKPRVGYMGGINELVDVALLDKLACAHREWSIVMIGQERGRRAFRRSGSYRALKSRANVHWLGNRVYDDLPGCVKGLDLCLLPFVRNPWMESSSPNKTFQYLAAGKPVVSTDFPEARRVDQVVAVADNANHFLSLCEREISVHSPEAVTARQTVARENSTARRAAAFLQLVKAELG